MGRGRLQDGLCLGLPVRGQAEFLVHKDKNAELSDLLRRNRRDGKITGEEEHRPKHRYYRFCPSHASPTPELACVRFKGTIKPESNHFASSGDTNRNSEFGSREIFGSPIEFWMASPKFLFW